MSVNIENCYTIISFALKQRIVDPTFLALWFGKLKVLVIW